MTEFEKTGVGIFVIINVIWGISWLISLYKFLKEKNEIDYAGLKIRITRPEYWAFIDFLLCILWVCLLIVAGGSLCSKLF